MRTKWILCLIWGVFVVLVFPPSIGAVEGDSLWSRNYGGDDYEYAYSVSETPDGGFIIAGYTDSYGAGYTDVYLIKTNASGDTIWTRTYGGGGYDYGFSVQQTQDGGYILAGTTDSFYPWDADIYVIKTDSDGDTIWTRAYGRQYNDYGYCVRQTQDGGYIIVGSLALYASGNDDLYLIKTNASGDTSWTRTFGSNNHDWGLCVQEISDGYIISGVSRPSGPSNNDVYLVRCNSSGNLVWARTYGGTGSEEGNCVQQTTDGGFIVAGYTTSLGTGTVDAWLLKTNSSGDTIWTRTYGASGSDEFACVDQVEGGGYIMAGYTSSWGVPYYSVYVVKADASGNMLWYRTYGGDGGEDGLCVQQISDGNYVVSGSTSSFSSSYDAWLIKIEGPGAGVEPQPKIHVPQPTLFPPRPNPFNTTTALSFKLQAASYASLKVYDTTGRLVVTLVDGWQEVGMHNLTFDGSNLAAGVYLVRLEAGGQTQVRRVVMMK